MLYQSFLYFFLLAIAKVYLEDGNKEYREGEVYNAIHYYTEGLQVNCKDMQLNAKIYSNRATAHFFVGKKFQFFNGFKDVYISIRTSRQDHQLGGCQTDC